MFYEGQRVTLKSVSDMIDEGILFQDGLQFGRIGDVSPALEGALIRRSHYSTSIILLNHEVKYLGQTGEVIVYSPNNVFFNSYDDEMLAEPERPLAIVMEDGYVLRLVPEFLVVPKDFNEVMDEAIIQIYEDIIEGLVEQNEALYEERKKLEAKIIELKRKLALAELRR